MDESVHKVILVRKASGEEEEFSTAKLTRSLANAGAKSDTIRKIIEDIENWIYHGVTTKKIYSRAFSLLQNERTNSSLKYRLKLAILELGPTGYPFEVLIGKMFRKMGYSTEVGIIVDGSCVTHEMDVIATKDKEQHLVECKYHKDQGKQVSVQVPLYVRSRVDDIIDKRKEMPEYKDFSFKGWVVTNTRFSSDSIQYGTCRGLKLMAWNFPEGNGLKENLEKYNIYPITVLKNLTGKEKQHLMGKGIVTCEKLLANLPELDEFKLSNSKYKKLISELEDICRY